MEGFSNGYFLPAKGREFLLSGFCDIDQVIFDSQFLNGLFKFVKVKGPSMDIPLSLP